jgi:choline dehydrogenase-like flavoprotein
VLAARLAENENFKILLLEAGRDSKDIDTVKMTMGFVKL